MRRDRQLLPGFRLCQFCPAYEGLDEVHTALLVGAESSNKKEQVVKSDTEAQEVEEAGCSNQRETVDPCRGGKPVIGCDG